jgi:hypothetical protein
MMMEIVGWQVLLPLVVALIPLAHRDVKRRGFELYGVLAVALS